MIVVEIKQCLGIARNGNFVLMLAEFRFFVCHFKCYHAFKISDHWFLCVECIQHPMYKLFFSFLFSLFLSFSLFSLIFQHKHWRTEEDRWWCLSSHSDLIFIQFRNPWSKLNTWEWLDMCILCNHASMHLNYEPLDVRMMEWRRQNPAHENAKMLETIRTTQIL